MKSNVEIFGNKDRLRMLRERYGAICEMIGEFDNWRRYSLVEEKYVNRSIEKLTVLKNYYLDEMYELELIIKYEETEEK